MFYSPEKCKKFRMLIFYYNLSRSDGKAPVCNAGHQVGWFGKIPWRRKWQTTPVLLPGKSHGLRSLVGYGPWGSKQSDTTE